MVLVRTAASVSKLLLVVSTGRIHGRPSAGAAIMKGFTTAGPLRRFVQVTIRWATITRVKLEIDYLPGIDNEWADALSRNKDFNQGFLPAGTAH